MKTIKMKYHIFVRHHQNCSRYQRFHKGIEYCNTQEADNKQQALCDAYSRIDSNNFFYGTNEDGSSNYNEVYDCNGNLMLELNDKQQVSIDFGDYTMEIFTDEELEEEYLKDYHKAIYQLS